MRKNHILHGGTNMIPQEQNQISLVDEEMRTSPCTFKDLCMRQIQACLTAGSKAMSPGGVRSVLIDGQAKTIIEPDTIEEFCNSVETLEILLSPQLENKKEEIKEYLEKYYKTREDLFNFEQKTSQELIRESHNDHSIKTGKYRDMIFQSNQNIDLLKIKLYRKLFRALSHLAAACNYFEEETA